MVGGAERLDSIVEAAFIQVAKVGFEGLRLRDVAAAAGIDHSTIHHYLPTKTDLVAAVAGYVTARLRTSGPEGGTAHQRLSSHLAALATMMEEQQILFVVSAELDLRARRDPAVAAIMSSHESGWRALLVVLIRDAYPAADPVEVAEWIIATVKGVRLSPDRARVVLGAIEPLITRAYAQPVVGSDHG